jgi:predicted lipoprotein
MSVGNVILNTYNKLTRRKKMAVSNALYKVGDTYTTQKSKVTGTILAIDPQANGNVRVKLDVNGSHRYTTWTAK